MQPPVHNADRPGPADPGNLPGGSGGLVPSFDAVYDQHFDFVWRTLRALGVPERALDDAVQEVFVVVHKRLAEFEHRSSLRTWLFSIAHHVARNARRGERRKGGHEELDPALPSDASGPEERVESARAWQFIEDFLAQLDPGKRAVFVLCLLEGATGPEAAEALEIPVNTVYTRLHAVRGAFREALASRYGGERP